MARKAPNFFRQTEPMRNIYIESFATFFKIGMFTLGGGYAMIPLIEQEVVGRRGWVTKEEMVDLIAISQSCPGVFAINLSTFIGYRLRKTRGALCTSIGTAMPSFLCILLIAMFFHQFGDNPVVAAIFRGIRPAVVALIAVPTFDLARSAKRGMGQLLDTHRRGAGHLGAGRVSDTDNNPGGPGRLHLRQVHQTN